MPNKDPNIQAGIIDLFLIAIAIAFAAIGGIAKYLAGVQEGKVPFSWLSLAIQGFISAFAGSIATLYLLENGYTPLMTVLGSGLFGFGGVVVLRFILVQLYNRIGIQEKIEKESISKREDV